MTTKSRLPILIFTWGGLISSRPCRNNDIAEHLCDYFDVIYLSSSTEVIREYRFKILNTRVFLALSRRGLYKLSAFIIYIAIRVLSWPTVRPIYVLNMGDNAAYIRHIRCNGYHFDLIDPCLSNLQDEQNSYELYVTNQVAISTSTSATSHNLLRRLCDAGASPVLVNNATAYTDNSDQLEQRPDCWDDSFKDVITYVGGLNIRVNYDFLELLSRSVPNSIIILTSTPTSAVSSYIERLANLNNVVLTGYLSDPEILYILRRTNIGLIPFVSDCIGDSINPQKLYDYCAFGIPIISTRTAEMEHFSQYVHFVDECNEMQLASLVDELLSGQPEEIVKLKQKFAEESTWQNRAAQLRNVILGHD